MAWKNGLVVNPQEILVWDDEDDKTITDEALAINHIDIDTHKTIAVNPEQAIKDVVSYVQDNFETRGRLVLGGHNTPFDIGFLQELMGLGRYDDHFMHRNVDTSVILRFLYHAGIIKQDIGSLENAMRYFGFSDKVLEGSHTAKVDALNAAKLYNRLLGKVVDAVRS